MPIVTKFYIEPPRAQGRKVCSNSPGHMTKRAAMPTDGKKLYKMFFSQTSGLAALKFDIHVALGTGVLQRLFK